LRANQPYFGATQPLRRPILNQNRGIQVACLNMLVKRFFAWRSSHFKRNEVKFQVWHCSRAVFACNAWLDGGFRPPASILQPGFAGKSWPRYAFSKLILL
jgi:hypothetical protein